MTTATRDHVHPAPSRPSAWRRARWLRLAIVLLLLAYLVGGYFFELNKLCSAVDIKARLDGCLGALKHPGHSVQDVLFTPDGQSLITATSDGLVHIWSTATQELRMDLRGHTNWASSLAITPDGATIVSGAWDKTVRLWRTSDGAPLRTLEGHTSSVWDVAAAPDGALVASISFDELILWRVADGVTQRRLDEVDGGRAIAFSPDSRQLAIADDSGVTLLEIATGARTTISTARAVEALLFSPDGVQLMGGTRLGVIYRWGLEASSELVLPHGGGAVSGLAFAPDGGLLASAAVIVGAASGDDPGLRLWRATDLRSDHRIEVDSHATSVAFAPDGQTLAIGSFERVYLWEVPPNARRAEP